MDAVKELTHEARNLLLQNARKQQEDERTLMISLATEIAMDINPFETILDTHGVTQSEFDRISKHPMFARFLSEASVQWNGSANTKARIVAKMEAGLEAALPELMKEIMGTGLTGPKVELIKSVMKGIGVGDAAPAPTRDGVNINIVFDAQKPIRDQRATFQIDHNAEEA